MECGRELVAGPLHINPVVTSTSQSKKTQLRSYLENKEFKKTLKRKKKIGDHERTFNIQNRGQTSYELLEGHKKENN